MTDGHHLLSWRVFPKVCEIDCWQIEQNEMNAKLIPKGISQYMLLIQNNYFEIATSKVDILRNRINSLVVLDVESVWSGCLKFCETVWSAHKLRSKKPLNLKVSKHVQFLKTCSFNETCSFKSWFQSFIRQAEKKKRLMI